MASAAGNNLAAQKKYVEVLKMKAIKLREEAEALPLKERASFKAPLASLEQLVTNFEGFVENAGALQECIRSTPSASEAGDTGILLYRAKLPKYNGDPRTWREWYSQFRVAIHENAKLPSNRDKMVQLKLYLEGDAKKIVDGHVADDPNGYTEALAALEGQCGDPTKLVQCYYRDLETLPAYHDSAPTADQLRSNLNAVTATLRSLRATKTNVDDRVLLRYVVEKFPADLVKTALRALRESAPTLNMSVEELTARLADLVYVEEFYEGQLSATKPGEPATVTPVTTFAATSRKRKNKGDHASTAPPAARPTAPSGAKNPTCRFCSTNGHTSRKCSTYATVEARKGRLSALNLCTCCMGPNHKADACRHAARPCHLCKQPGHVVPMCPSAHQKDRAGRKEETTGRFLPTFLCTLQAHGKHTLVRGFLDGGSDTSYIHEAALSRLGLEIRPDTTISVSAFTSEHSPKGQTFPSQKLTLELIGLSGARIPCQLYSSPNLMPSHARLSPSAEDVCGILPVQYHYADPDLFTHKRRPIEMLIGSDQYYLLVNVKQSKQLSPKLVLLKTHFGWSPAGSATYSSEDAPKRHLSTVHCASVQPKQSSPTLELLPGLQRLWDLESFGIRITELESVDAQVLQSFRQTTRKENNRYIVRWPWKTENPVMQTHFRLAFARLKSELGRTPPDTILKCDTILQEQLSSGIIENVTNPTSQYPVHYIPHRPIIQNGKVRIVYDASAKTSSSRSLNDHLHQGPTLIANLVGLLINFRLWRIGVIADIEKAFLMVGLDISDRDVVRFLWPRDLNKPLTKENLITYRFARVPFGVNASPYLLNMVIQDHLSDHQGWPAEVGRTSFYVDNLVTSCSQVSDATYLYQQLTSLMSAAGFNLRDWASNHPDFPRTLPEDKLMQKDDPVSVLGLAWDRKRDTIGLKFEAEECPSSGTLSSVLSLLATVYDPLGLVAPCLLELRLLVQDCWKAKLSWDDALPTSLEVRLRKAVVERNSILQIKVPRHLWNHPAHHEAEYELHIFTDASERAFGCAIYLLCKHQSSKPESALIFSKARVAPILSSKTTIPRLELMGALLGKRAASSISPTLKVAISRTILWTDATTLLQWLHSPKIQPPFVQNRLNELRRTPSLTIRHVPTADNPADANTRGKTPAALANLSLWWRGPDWLPYEALWPSPPASTETYTTPATTLFVWSKQTEPCDILMSSHFGRLGNTQLEKRFSRWHSYIRMFSCIFRPLLKLRGATTSQISERAETTLLHLLQVKYFPEDLTHFPCNSQLQLFVHTDGLVRCRSRLRATDFEWAMTCPILLPRESPLVRVLIYTLHVDNHHIGASHLLTILRQRFWVAKARALVKSVVHQCMICRKYTTGAFRRPDMPQLPSVRVNPIIPFAHVGVDYFGPLFARDTDGIDRKVYCCIFVCLVTRAIHLELTRDMSGYEFLLSFLNFTGIRGTPVFIVSDNGTNFTFIQPMLGPKVTLKDYEVSILDHQVQQHFLKQKVNWYFIPAYSPWYGGAYERLIGLVKRYARTLLHPTTVNPVAVNTRELSVAMTRIADIVNSRPLCYVPSDELTPIQTPNHFLKPFHPYPNETTAIDPNKVTSSSRHLLTGYRHIQGLVENCRSFFKRHYFSMLRDIQVHHHRHSRGSHRRKPEKGEAVLIFEPTAPRTQWLAGVIDEVLDREAWVTTVVRNTGLNIDPSALLQKRRLLRTFAHLYPLEASYDNPEKSPIPTPTDHTYPQPSAQPGCSSWS